MKISTKGRYGLRSMVDLAINSSNSHISLSNISESQNISLNYLEQVFAVLRKAGIVKSVKGAQGGYALAKKLSDITVGDILRSLEGDLSVFEKSTNINNNSIENFIENNIWQKIDDSVNQFVNSKTLENIVVEYKKTQNIPFMFYI